AAPCAAVEGTRECTRGKRPIHHSRIPVMLIRSMHRRIGLVRAIVGLVSVVGCGGAAASPPEAPASLPATNIHFDSASVRVVLGTDRRLVAIVRDGTGGVLAGQDIRWSSTNPAVVFVSSSGLAHGVALGSATITAVVGSHLALDTVTVIAAPSP